MISLIRQAESCGKKESDRERKREKNTESKKHIPNQNNKYSPKNLCVRCNDTFINVDPSSHSHWRLPLRCMCTYLILLSGPIEYVFLFYFVLSSFSVIFSAYELSDEFRIEIYPRKIWTENVSRSAQIKEMLRFDGELIISSVEIKWDEFLAVPRLVVSHLIFITSARGLRKTTVGPTISILEKVRREEWERMNKSK